MKPGLITLANTDCHVEQPLPLPARLSQSGGLIQGGAQTAIQTPPPPAGGKKPFFIVSKTNC